MEDTISFSTKESTLLSPLSRLKSKQVGLMLASAREMFIEPNAPVRRPQTAVPSRPTFSASSAVFRQPVSTPTPSMIKTEPESTACRRPVFKVPSKKVFRPPWADSATKPTTFHSSDSFAETRHDEDDRPLSELLSKEPAFRIS